jgi:hypothetical protein
MLELTNYALITVFIASLAALLIASEIGHHFGSRAGGEANISTLEAAMLGLLALMIGFTFAMALTRFDERRAALLDEANSIGTAALRARLLPAPHGADSLKLLRDYVQIRLELTSHVPTAAEMHAAIVRSNEIQEALWSDVKLVMAKDNAVAPTALYIQALNEMFDNQEKRLTALRNRVPNTVILVLYGISVVVVGFSGYSSGAAERRWRLPVYIMGLLIAAVVLLIQDLDRPDAGIISVSQQPMVDTANALATY